MDKSRDVRPGGTSGFSPAKRQSIKQSGIDGSRGDSVFSEKLKRERMRKLSVLGKVHSNGKMGGSGPDVEDELHPTSISKRFKLPGKFFHDCNTVDYASVPRKLRSAMRKRNNESISPPLPDKKLPNHGINGVELPSKDGIKKSRLNQQGNSKGSPSRPIVGPITKDEEEVVETLYALAVMFPDNNTKNGLDGELAKAKSSPLPGENSRPAFEAPEKEEDSKSLCPSTIVEAANPSLLEESAQETVEVKCSNEPSQPGFLSSTQLDNNFSQRNFQAMPVLSKSELIHGKPSCTSVGCNVQSETSLGKGTKQPKNEEAAACVKKPEITVGPAAAVNNQRELQHTLKDSKNSGRYEGSACWPGLSSAGSLGAGTLGPSLQLSTTRIPSWLGMAASTIRPRSLDNGALTERDSGAPAARKNSWKRSSGHVYISRLIKVLQIAEKTDRLPTQPTQLTPNEGSKQGVHLAANNLNGVRNGLNGAVPAHNIVGPVAERNPNEVRNAVLLHKRPVQDQPQASTPSALYTSQKQSFDFLSLSAGGSGVDAASSTNKAGNGLEPLNQFHLPYLQSLVQNHTIMPFTLPQNRFSSTPFTDHLPVAAAAKQVQIQPSPYLGSSLFSPPHVGNTASPKQQQQQWIWTAQYKPVGLAASHIPNWQNGRQDPSAAVQYAQSIPPPSYYTPTSQQQQQQQLIAVTSSLPAARAKRQHHHLPSGYNGDEVGSYPDHALPLQLLCNERL